MDEAVAMHDKCLRSVLHQHHGYEVKLKFSGCVFVPGGPVKQLVHGCAEETRANCAFTQHSTHANNFQSCT